VNDGHDADQMERLDRLATVWGAEQKERIEQLAAAWIKANPGLHPEETELVEERSSDGLAVRWRFRRRGRSAQRRAPKVIEYALERVRRSKTPAEREMAVSGLLVLWEKLRDPD